MRRLILLVLLLPTLVTASHGVGSCRGAGISMGAIEVGIGHATGTFYVDDRNFFLGNGVWTYAETNGVYVAGASAHDNLQRGGEAFWSSSALPENRRHTDGCRDVGEWVPDTLIY